MNAMQMVVSLSVSISLLSMENVSGNSQSGRQPLGGVREAPQILRFSEVANVQELVFARRSHTYQAACVMSSNGPISRATSIG